VKLHSGRHSHHLVKKSGRENLRQQKSLRPKIFCKKKFERGKNRAKKFKPQISGTVNFQAEKFSIKKFLVRKKIVYEGFLWQCKSIPQVPVEPMRA
jgi:hypothetical protein